MGIPGVFLVCLLAGTSVLNKGFVLAELFPTLVDDAFLLSFGLAFEADTGIIGDKGASESSNCG